MRPPWESLPPDVQAWVGAALGSTVVAAVSEAGGHSPGVAARVRCASGRRAFVKAVSAQANPDTPELHRREARVAAALPAQAGAPALLDVLDRDPWVVLVLEEVDGRPPALPWRRDELDAALGLLDRLAEALTPSPLALPQAAEVHDLHGWRLLATSGAALDDPWQARHLDALVALEDRYPQASAGQTLLHLDVRADNLLLRPDGGAVLVDWPHAALGAAWSDVVLLAPSVEHDGGPAAPEVLRRCRVGREADPAAVAVAVAAFTGLMEQRRREAPPPGMPRVRALQAALGRVAQRWLADLTGWR